MKTDLVERLPHLLARLEMAGVACPQSERGGWKLYECEAALYELRELAPALARTAVSQAAEITRLRETLATIADDNSWRGFSPAPIVERMREHARAALQGESR